MYNDTIFMLEVPILPNIDIGDINIICSYNMQIL